MYFDDAHYSLKTLQHTAIEHSECKHSTYHPDPLPTSPNSPLPSCILSPPLRRQQPPPPQSPPAWRPMGGCSVSRWAAAGRPFPSAVLLLPTSPPPPFSSSPSHAPPPPCLSPFPTSRPCLPSPRSVCHNSFSSLFSLALLFLDTPLSIFRGTLEPEPSHIPSVLRMELRVVANTGKQRAGRGFCVYVCLWAGTCRPAQSPRPVPRVRGRQE